MNDPVVIQGPLPPCEKCGRDTLESRAYDSPDTPTGTWRKRNARCVCGHDFDVWCVTLDYMRPLFRSGVIHNVSIP